MGPGIGWAGKGGVLYEKEKTFRNKKKDDKSEREILGKTVVGGGVLRPKEKLNETRREVWSSGGRKYFGAENRSQENGKPLRESS